MALNRDEMILAARKELARRELERRRGISGSQKQKESIPQMLESNLKEAYAEGVAPAVHGLSTMAFGVPKVIVRDPLKMFGLSGVAKKIMPEQYKKIRDFGQKAEEVIFPEQKTIQGKAFRGISEVAGLFRGGAAKTAELAGKSFLEGTKKFLPKAAGLGSTKEVIGTRRKAIILQKALRSGVEGATFGATQLDVASGLPYGSEDGPTFSGQLKQAATGAVLGAGFEKARQGVSGGVRAFRKFRLPTKTEPGKELERRARDISGGSIEKLRTGRINELSMIDDSIKNTKNLRQETLEKHGISSKEKINLTTQRLKQNVRELDDSLVSESEAVSKKIQEKLPSFYRANSESYGTRLDEISDDLMSMGESIRIGDIDDSLNQAIQDLDDALLNEGSARQAISFLKNKYGIKINEDLTTNVDDIISFKELVSDFRKIRKLISTSGKEGTKRFTPDDVGVNIVNKSLGELIKSKSPEFAELQQAYRPIIQAMKASNRLFKPFKGEFETKTGTGLLKRYALGKTEAGEEALIKAIQEGSDFAPGLGKITEGLKSKGQKLIASKQRIKPILDEMSSGQLLKKQNIDKEFSKQLYGLTLKKKFVEAGYQQKEELIKDALSKRLRQIGYREEQIENLIKDKNKTSQLIYALLKIGGGIALIKTLQGSFFRDK